MVIKNIKISENECFINGKRYYSQKQVDDFNSDLIKTLEEIKSLLRVGVEGVEVIVYEKIVDTLSKYKNNK
jgi:hypothetical protein